MGRPNLGGAARSNVASIKLTDTEKAALTLEFGSTGKALRALVNAHLRGDTDIIDETYPTPGAHRHKPGTKIMGERIRQGVTEIQPLCADCGLPMPWRKKKR